MERREQQQMNGTASPYPVPPPAAVRRREGDVGIAAHNTEEAKKLGNGNFTPSLDAGTNADESSNSDDDGCDEGEAQRRRLREEQTRTSALLVASNPALASDRPNRKLLDRLVQLHQDTALAEDSACGEGDAGDDRQHKPPVGPKRGRNRVHGRSRCSPVDWTGRQNDEQSVEGTKKGAEGEGCCEEDDYGHCDSPTQGLSSRAAEALTIGVDRGGVGSPRDDGGDDDDFPGSSSPSWSSSCSSSEECYSSSSSSFSSSSFGGAGGRHSYNRQESGSSDSSSTFAPTHGHSSALESSDTSSLPWNKLRSKLAKYDRDNQDNHCATSDVAKSETWCPTVSILPNGFHHLSPHETRPLHQQVAPAHPPSHCMYEWQLDRHHPPPMMRHQVGSDGCGPNRDDSNNPGNYSSSSSYHHHADNFLQLMESCEGHYHGHRSNVSHPHVNHEGVSHGRDDPKEWHRRDVPNSERDLPNKRRRTVASTDAFLTPMLRTSVEDAKAQAKTPPGESSSSSSSNSSSSFSASSQNKVGKSDASSAAVVTAASGSGSGSAEDPTRDAAASPTTSSADKLQQLYDRGGDGTEVNHRQGVSRQCGGEQRGRRHHSAPYPAPSTKDHHDEGSTSLCNLEAVPNHSGHPQGASSNSESASASASLPFVLEPRLEDSLRMQMAMQGRHGQPQHPTQSQPAQFWARTITPTDEDDDDGRGEGEDQKEDDEDRSATGGVSGMALKPDRVSTTRNPSSAAGVASSNSSLSLERAVSHSPNDARIIAEASSPHRIVHANAAFSRLTGIESYDAVGKPASRILLPLSESTPHPSTTMMTSHSPRRLIARLFSKASSTSGRDGGRSAAMAVDVATDPRRHHRRRPRQDINHDGAIEDGNGDHFLRCLMRVTPVVSDDHEHAHVVEPEEGGSLKDQSGQVNLKIPYQPPSAVRNMGGNNVTSEKVFGSPAVDDVHRQTCSARRVTHFLVQLKAHDAPRPQAAMASRGNSAAIAVATTTHRGTASLGYMSTAA